MSETEASPAPSATTHPTGSSHAFRLERETVHVIEVQGMHFHAGSAVLMPVIDVDVGSRRRPEDEEVTVLAVIRRAFLHLEENPDQMERLC